MPNSKPMDAFKIHYSMMTTAGIWPKLNSSKTYKIRTAISWILSGGVFLTMCIEAANDLNDVTKLTEILYIMVTYAAYLIKLAAFTYHRKTFLETIEFLEDPVFTSYPDDLDHYMATAIKYSKIIANTYRYLVLILVILYGIYPILDKVPLAFPFPYDLGNYAYIMFTFQLTAEACAAWNNTCLDTLCTAFMGLGNAQMDILAEKITRCKQPDSSETETYENLDEVDVKTIAYLNQCVKHHLAIIRIINVIESIFTLGLLCQFVASAIVICNTLFHFVLISISLQYVMLIDYFAAMVLQLFMYCWYGNNILWKSVQIGDACYHANWHLCGHKVRKCLFIIMERSKRPLKVTTLGFSTLSLRAFLSIMQWSYSYLTLLLRMYYKK